jgi:glycosyltransferase involved in cell wall biosynthesis
MALSNRFIDAHNQNSFVGPKGNEVNFSDQIIYCAHARLNYMSPPLYSSQQIFVGPRDETNYVAGATTGFVKTSFGKYALAEYIDKHKLPEPKLIVVHADEFQTNLPTDINEFTCKKIMVLGDTHQSSQGLLKVLDYFKNHEFNYYFSDCKKNHLHFFYESAPDRNFVFFPSFRNRFEAKTFKGDKKKAISLLGQLKPAHHPYRLSIADKLKSSGFPVLISESLQEQAVDIYSDFLINVNVSLNNDFNMRFIEVISAGGFLLTDRISTFTGYEDIFKENEDFVFYDTEQDLMEKIRYYFNHPEKAIKIAKSGWQKFISTWSINKRREKFWDLINLDARHNLPNFKDQRFLPGTNQWLDHLDFRAAFYGFLQEINKKGFSQVWLPADVHSVVSSDAADLCRLRLQAYDQVQNISHDHPIDGLENLPAVLVARRDDLQILANDKAALSKFENIITI